MVYPWFFFFCVSVTRPKLPLGQICNHATCDVYSPKAVETNPDWIVIYPMDSFIQILNNQARCVAKGCSELVNNFLAITVYGSSKAKKINNNNIIFAQFIY